jgi:hypothetical protein
MRYLTLSPATATALEWQAGAYFSSLVALYSLPIVVHMWLDRDEKSARAEVPKAFYNSLAMRTVTAAGLFGATLLLRTATSADFIYFQF